MIWLANQLTGFCMVQTKVFKISGQSTEIGQVFIIIVINIIIVID